jgi:hypothetical protein
MDYLLKKECHHVILYITQLRACGGSPPHERLRSRNSRHLQCCPSWCPRGIPAARYYPRGTGGGGWWRVTGYFLAGCGLFCRVPFFFWSWWRASPSQSRLICSFFAI